MVGFVYKRTSRFWGFYSNLMLPILLIRIILIRMSLAGMIIGLGESVLVAVIAKGRQSKK